MKANEFIIAPENAGKSIVEIMQLYSDQQNKELRETINNVLNKTESDKDVIIIEQGFTLQRLMKELDEVKTSHYQKLDAQLIEDVERLSEENKELREDYDQLLNVLEIKEIESKAEIQRLTKEVEQLRANNYDLAIESQEGFEENTRLRELLGRTSGGLSNLVFTAGKLWDEVKPIKDSDAITVTHPIIEEAKKLLTEIDNALNHKP